MLKSKGLNVSSGLNGAWSSDKEESELPFAVVIFRKAYTSILEEIKELVFSQENDDNLQKYFYNETSELKARFGKRILQHKEDSTSRIYLTKKSSSPSSRLANWCSNSVSSMEEEGTSHIHSPPIKPLVMCQQRKNGVQEYSKPIHQTFVQKSLPTVGLNSRHKISKESLSSTKSRLASWHGQSGQAKPLLSNAKELSSINFNASPDLLSSILRSQSHSLALYRPNKKPTIEEPEKAIAKTSFKEATQETLHANSTPSVFGGHKAIGCQSSPFAEEILSQDLNLSTDESDVEPFNQSHNPCDEKIDHKILSQGNLSRSELLSHSEKNLDKAKPVNFISETSETIGDKLTSKRKRSSHTSNLFSDSSDEESSPPRKVFLKNSQLSSDERGFSVSDSSDEEKGVISISQNQNEANPKINQTPMKFKIEENPSSTVTTMSPLCPVNSDCLPAKPLVEKESIQVMPKPGESFFEEFNGAKGRPLANGYHSNGVSFLEELQDAVCNEKYEKYESIHDSLYLVTDQRVVGQIKDLICSQLGRLTAPNQKESILPNVVELLSRNTTVKIESRNIIYQQIILEKIKDEKNCDNFCHPDLNLTLIQCKLIMLVLAMDKSGKFGNFLTNVLNLAYSTLFVRGRSRSLKPLPILNLTKFFMSLCKTRGFVTLAGDFLVNLFHSEPTRVHLFLTTVIETWPELLMDMKRNGRIDPLVQTILWLTFNKGSRGDEAVKICRSKLITLCFVEKYSVSATEFALTLIDWAKNYIGHEDVMNSLVGCFRMLTRYFDNQWLYTNVLSILLNMIKEFKMIDEPEEKKEARLTWVVETIGTVGRNFPASKRNTSLEFLIPITDILRTKDPIPGPALETACLKSIVLLGQHLQMQVVDFLFEWSPNYQLDERCKKILANYLNQRARLFTSRKLLKVRRERLCALAQKGLTKK